MSLLKRIIAEAAEVDEVAELVALLSISQLPTVVVEEASDVRLWSRWMEQRLLGTYNVDALAAGGLENLLRVYEQRHEFAHVPVVFVANRGMWLFTRISEHYDDIIWTKGYSVENDVYSMGEIEKLLDSTRFRDYWRVRESVIRWFAFEVEEFRVSKKQLHVQESIGLDRRDHPIVITKKQWRVQEHVLGSLDEEFRGEIPPEVDSSLDEIVPEGQTKLGTDFRKRCKFRYPDSQTIQEISGGFQFKIPGKFLFEMLARFSSIPLHGLYNIALTNYEAAPGRRGLIKEVKEKLGKQGFTSSQKILSSRKIQNPVPTTQRVKDSGKGLLSRKLTPQIDFVEKSDFFVNKLVIDLKNTSLPTIVVEGKDNANIIEKLIKHHGVKEFLGVKDVKVRDIPKRARLLSAYDRRREFVHILPVAFVADREMGLFTGIPERYADIIWTQGYSLENDLYADADLELLLEPHEIWRHQQVLNSTIEWFAFEVEEFLGGNPARVDFKLSEIVPQGEFKLSKGFCQHRGFRQPSAELIQHIRERYQFLLPGNFLFQVLARFLSIRCRDFNFNVSGRSLYDIALEIHDSQFQSRLYNLMQKIMDKLEEEKERIGALRKPRSKQNQTWKSQNVQPSGPSQLIRKPKVKLGDKVNAIILRKEDNIKVTVQLQTDNREEIAFEYPYYPGRVGDKVKLKVMDIDGTGRIRKVVP